jgi:hypothetical protein
LISSKRTPRISPIPLPVNLFPSGCQYFGISSMKQSY